MADRRQGLSKEQCAAVLRALAQLHAASFALREGSPEEFAALAQSVREMFWTHSRRHAFEPFMRNANKETLRLIGDYYGSSETEFSRAFQQIADLGFEFLADIVTKVPENKKVLLHGDCWTNNLLFKTNDDGVVSAKLLDFQLARISAPMIDLIFFLFTSTKPKNVGNYLEEFLQVYYEEFERRLKAAGFTAAKLYPESELLADWIACVPYGLVVAGILAPALYCPDECLPNLESVKENSREAFVNEYGKVMQANTPESKEHLGRLVKLCVERKWLRILN
ncbi:Hypothetical predicted protein [Cloeon dipterum]|uniref:CHK kinase-like domain-containing protein n=1 Tax=Cloeon dipterum TaxID=197152 RepID=A0A8S1DSS4_9INSE|nr:Hypothetical predicted protein [Cloeon dipterum]